MELIKLHWQLIKNPSKVIKETFDALPIQIGVFVYCLYLISIFQNPQTSTIINDVMVSVFGIVSEYNTLIYILFICGYTVLLQYYLLPFILNNIVEKEKRKNFNRDHYRKIIFYSPLSYVIFAVLFMLPIQIILSFLMLDGELNTLVFILIGLQSIIALWSLVLTINVYVVQWKGLKIKYELENFKVFFLIFVVPFIMAIPFLIMFGSNYLDFLNNYLK